jgi:heme/copper-type cytochrome/quinol oxidase subunit 2
MESMEKKKWYGIVAACVIVACVVLAVVLQREEPTVPGTQETPVAPAGPSGPTLENEGYVSDIPQDAVVTTPAAEAPAAPNVTERFRVYGISVTVDGYTPDTIVVNKGDVVQLNLTAVDGPYDFSMPYNGLSQSMAKGETKQVNFGATAEGTFEFRCSAVCPASGTIRGKFIVLP